MLPLIALPILAFVAEYSFAIADHNKMLEAARAGARAMHDRISQVPPQTEVLPAGSEILDVGEAAVNDFLNDCNHTIPGDCDPTLHKEQNYKINIYRQDMGVPEGEVINYLAYKPGVVVSISRVKGGGVFGFRLHDNCAAVWWPIPMYDGLIVKAPLACSDRRLTNPLNEQPYEWNSCFSPENTLSPPAGACLGSPEAKSPGCGDEKEGQGCGA